MQPVALQQPVEGGAIDARGPGGSGHVAARLRHELAEVAELELGDKTITRVVVRLFGRDLAQQRRRRLGRELVAEGRDRKSTRLNSSHGYISYAVFCLKKKKKPDLTAD